MNLLEIDDQKGRPRVQCDVKKWSENSRKILVLWGGLIQARAGNVKRHPNDLPMDVSPDIPRYVNFHDIFHAENYT